MATKTNRLGETRMMNCGMEATIIRYGKYSDIDVRFEDGVIVEHKRYRAFENGNIANPNFNPRLGETKMMNCGMEATIIRYGGSADIDVRFEDGIVVEHREYREFEKGGIINPNIKATAENRLDETCMMNCGMKATIIRYGKYSDIDIRFEDGKVVVHKKYDQFKKGEIANPNMKVSAKNRLGETRMMNCGMKATIIRYGNAGDIDVRFEDRAIAKRKGYREFKKGKIANPNIKTSAENLLGETWMMNCGMEATIIRYGGCNDIDVRFEDGTIVGSKTYNAFKKGSIANQNIKTSAENCLGETRMMNCGMETTIIRYNTSKDIDVRFGDGTVVKYRTYNQFKKGEIAHQSLSLNNGSKDFHGFICRRGFIDEDRTLYECICKHCGLEDVLTPQEMMEHEKLEHGEGK